jgi:alkaline phosphatase
MKKIIRKILVVFLAGLLCFSATACKKSGTIILKNVSGKAKNVILLIGDGMGPVQIEAGALYKGEPLAMQGFPYKTTVETRSNDSSITDSAAAATALATGVRTNNGVISRDPNTREDLQTIVDVAYGLDKSTGVIATEEIYGATPMGFSGHSDSRAYTEELVYSVAASSNLNFIASYTIDNYYQSFFYKAGYVCVPEVEKISESNEKKIYGFYNIDAVAPSMTADNFGVALDKLVTEALEFLAKDEDGFFLMVEGSHIDHGGHNNHIMYMLEELLAFDDAVKAVLEWAKDRDDTVVIVTADHETGGLTLGEGLKHNAFKAAIDGGEGQGDMYAWSTTGHSATDVNLYINGADVDFSKFSFGTNERIKNIDVFQIMKGLLYGTL